MPHDSHGHFSLAATLDPADRKGGGGDRGAEICFDSRCERRDEEAIRASENRACWHDQPPPGFCAENIDCRWRVPSQRSVVCFFESREVKQSFRVP